MKNLAFLVLLPLLCLSTNTYSQQSKSLKLHFSTDVDNFIRHAVSDDSFPDDYSYSYGVSQDYNSDIGLIIVKPRQSFGLGLSFGGLRTHNEGFGQRHSLEDDYGGEYISTGAQLRAYWLSYAYEFYKRQTSLSAYYKFKYDKLYKEGFYTSNSDGRIYSWDSGENYYRDLRVQYIHELGLFWISKPLWGKVEIQLNAGITAVIEEVNSVHPSDGIYVNRVLDKEYRYPLNANVGFNYLLHNDSENDRNTKNSSFSKSLRLSHVLFFDTYSADFIFKKSIVDVGFGLFMELAEAHQKWDYPDGYKTLGISVFAMSEFKTSSSIKPWMAAKLSKTIHYAQINEYSSAQKMNNLKLALEFGAKRHLFSTVSIGASIDHVYVHNYNKTLYNHNEQGWTMNTHLFFDF